MTCRKRVNAMQQDRDKDDLVDALADISSEISHMRDTADDKLCEVDEVLEEARDLLKKESDERRELQKTGLYQRGWNDAMAMVTKLMEAGPVTEKPEEEEDEEDEDE